jgi:UDP-N-acetylglucosamine--N-acetylmuramyl-(pentapeptide) pyrophosphoryl-undecaprenol N-acetylglucosamine transferase
MTAVFVASTGGHLSQMVELAARIEEVGEDATWVTFDTPQSRSLLQGRRSVFIAPIEERDVIGVLRGAASANALFRSLDVSAVVSTGSGTALSFLPIAAARGIPAHYIESAARVLSPSLSGRLLERVPRVHLYCQYPCAATRCWKFVGSVFDGFEPHDAGSRPIEKIVVTLGSGVHSFRRLVDRLVAVLPSHIEILWQTGATPVDDLPIEAQPIIPEAALAAAIRSADAVIGHAGCGFALTALNLGKLPILLPREPRHGELVDDHQVELARFLGKRGLAIHRTPDTVTIGDIALAAARGVCRRTAPPTLDLRLAS